MDDSLSSQSHSPPVNPEAPTSDGQMTGAYDQRFAGDRTMIARPIPVIAGYTMVRELGHGGMGTVFLAQDTKLNRQVAVKTIFSGAFASESELLRFRTEAKAVARITHPNIVQVHDAGTTSEGMPYLVMEFCSGGSLSDRLKGTPFTADDSARLVQALADGLAAAHGAGVIHRDLKPGNILLTHSATRRSDGSAASDSRTPRIPSDLPVSGSDGSSASNRTGPALIAKVGDFGLAKLVDTADGNTRSGAVLGTPRYMAPEQAFGETKNVGPVADVYSLGAILYELLTGRPPFRGATDAETLDQVRYREPVPPRLLTNVPRDLETICLKCLHKEPVKRYSGASALAEDLERFLAKRPILARPIGPTGRLVRWARRNPGIAVLTTTVAALLVTVAITAVASALSWRSQKNKIEILLQKEQAAHEEAEKERKLAADEAIRNQYLVRFVLWDVAGQLQNNPKAREAVLRRTFAEIERQSISTIEQGRFFDRGRMSVDLQLGELYLVRAQAEAGADRDKSLLAAGRHFQTAIATAQKLVDAEPQSAKARGNLAVVLNSAGRMQLDARNFEKARQLYEQARDLRQAVLDDPGPRGEANSLRLADVRLSLANSYGALADLARVQKDRATGTRMLDQAIALVREGIALVEADPANTEQSGGLRTFKSDLARYSIISARDRLGDRSPAGRQAVQQLLTETEQLLASTTTPNDLESSLDLARLLAQSGDNYLFSTTDSMAAKTNYQRSLAILENIRKATDTREIQSEIAMGHYRMGTALLRLKEYGNASAQYQMALEIREQHFKELPTERARLTLMVTVARAGDVRRASQMVDEFRPLTQLKDEFPFDAACTYAICAWVTGGWRPDADLTPEQMKQRQEFVQKALAEVRIVRKSGSSYAGQLTTDPDLEFLHGRPEFQTVMSEPKK